MLKWEKNNDLWRWKKSSPFKMSWMTKSTPAMSCDEFYCLEFNFCSKSNIYHFSHQWVQWYFCFLQPWVNQLFSLCDFSNILSSLKGHFCLREQLTLFIMVHNWFDALWKGYLEIRLNGITWKCYVAVSRSAACDAFTDVWLPFKRARNK